MLLHFGIEITFLPKVLISHMTPNNQQYRVLKEIFEVKNANQIFKNQLLQEKVTDFFVVEKNIKKLIEQNPPQSVSHIPIRTLQVLAYCLQARVVTKHNIKIMLPKLEDYVITEHLFRYREDLKCLEDYEWLKSAPKLIYDEKDLFQAHGRLTFDAGFRNGNHYLNLMLALIQPQPVLNSIQYCVQNRSKIGYPSFQVQFRDKDKLKQMLIRKDTNKQEKRKQSMRVQTKSKDEYKKLAYILQAMHEQDMKVYYLSLTGIVSKQILQHICRFINQAPEGSIKTLDFMKLTLKKNQGINDIWNACRDSRMFNSIQAFNISSTDFTKISAPIPQVLCNVNGLLYLNISGCKFISEQISKIGYFQSIRFIDAKNLQISCSKNRRESIDEVMATFLRNITDFNQTLQVLNLQYNKCGPQSGKQIIQLMRKIESIIAIDVSFNQIPERVITNMFIRATKMRSFESLRVQGNIQRFGGNDNINISNQIVQQINQAINQKKLGHLNSLRQQKKVQIARYLKNQTGTKFRELRDTMYKHSKVQILTVAKAFKAALKGKKRKQMAFNDFLILLNQYKMNPAMYSRLREKTQKELGMQKRIKQEIRQNPQEFNKLLQKEVKRKQQAQFPSNAITNGDKSQREYNKQLRDQVNDRWDAKFGKNSGASSNQKQLTTSNQLVAKPRQTMPPQQPHQMPHFNHQQSIPTYQQQQPMYGPNFQQQPMYGQPNFQHQQSMYGPNFQQQPMYGQPNFQHQQSMHGGPQQPMMQGFYPNQNNMMMQNGGPPQGQYPQFYQQKFQ